MAQEAWVFCPVNKILVFEMGCGLSEVLGQGIEGVEMGGNPRRVDEIRGLRVLLRGNGNQEIFIASYDGYQTKLECVLA
jgi:hypothetical protein